MNLAIIGIAALFTGVAFVIGTKLLNAYKACAIVEWILGALLIGISFYLFSATAWRSIAIGLLVFGMILMITGIFVFRYKDKTKYSVELDELLIGVANNAANNYKDAAQEYYQKFLKKYEALKAEGKMNEKQIAYYDGMKDKYAQELKNFHH